MSLSTYQLVVAIAEYGNMTRAAESLHITPSAASHAISALEDSFGFPIFHRGRSGATLTPLGQSLLPRIRTILSEEAHLQEEISKIHGLYDGTVHIGVFNTVCTHWLPSILRSFQTKYPNIQVRIFQDSYTAIEEKLLENAMDFALIESAPRSGKLVCRRFSGDRMVAVCSPKDPLAKKQGVTLAQLMTKPLLLREKGSGTRDLFDSVARSHNLTAEPMWESVNTQALIEAVAMGLGVSVLPWRLVQDSVGRGLLQVVPVQDALFRRDFNILYHPDKYQTKPARDFLALCQEAGEELEE